MSSAVLPSRNLGPKLRSTVVGFGAAAISGDSGGYGFGAMTEKESLELLGAVYERGIRLFDTAPIYGFGESERRLGAFFKSHPTSLADSVIVTKLGVDWDSELKVAIDNSPETVKRMLGESLDRLGLSKVQVYMIHWPDPKVEVEKTMEALVRLKEQGLFDSIGASNFTPELIRRAESVAPIEVLQNPLNLLNPAAVSDLLPLCSDSRGFMSYATLAKGLLSGTVTADREFDSSDVRARNDGIKTQAAVLEAELGDFFSLAKQLDVTGSVLAAAWVLSQGGVSTALCGSKKLAQVDEIVRAAALEIPPAMQVRLSQLSGSMSKTLSTL